MNSDYENILRLLKVVLVDKSVALEFIINELSFANKSSLVVRNFAKSSGIKLKEELPILELDSPNILFSNRLASLGTYQSTIELRLQIIDEVMKIHHVGKYSNIDDRELIRNFCNEREIKELIHFTEAQNVRSILDIGLNSKDYNSEIAKRHKINDTNRFDYRTHMISLSISYPNDKMFYKYRKSNPSQQWAILSLSPNILWELDCLFCPTNAANSSISSVNDESWSGSQALKRMFVEQSEKLRMCDPYDSQAEVLVNSHIPSKYIESIFVERHTDSLSEINGDVIINPFYFHKREFALSNV